MTTPREMFVLTIRDVAAPDDAPVAIRLRHVLKRLLRSLAFRAVEVRRAPAEDRQRPAQAPTEESES